MKKSIFLVSTLLSGIICYSANSMADDIDIYLKGKSTVQTFSNTLLMVDSSGSMQETLPNGEVKLFAAQKSIMDLINSLNDQKRVGLATYNGNGGSIIYPIKSLNNRVYRTSVSKIKTNQDDFVEGKESGIKKSTELYLGFGKHGVEKDLKIAEFPLHNNTNKTSMRCVDGTEYAMDTDSLKLGGFDPCYDGYELSLLFHGINLPKNAVISEAMIELTRKDEFSNLREVDVNFDLYNNVGGKHTNGKTYHVFSDGQAQTRTETMPNPEYIPPVYYEGIMITPGQGEKNITVETTNYTRVINMDNETRTNSDTGSVDEVIENVQKGINESMYLSSQYVIAGTVIPASRKVYTPDISDYIKDMISEGKNKFMVRMTTILNAAYNNHDLMVFHSDKTEDVYDAPKLIIKYYDSDINADSDNTFVGLNFRNVNIASNSKVDDAKLRITASGDATDASITIKVMDYINTDNEVFDGSTISGMGVIDQKTIAVPEWVNGTKYMFDVADLVESAVARSGFCGGDNILFVLESSTLPKMRAREFYWTNYAGVDTELTVKQGEVAEDSCARVTYYEGNTLENATKVTKKRFGIESLRSVKEQLIYSALHDIVPDGRTPTLGSTLEAFNYMTGKEVSERAKTRDSKYKRISHEDSFSGDTYVTSRMGCSDDSRNHADCSFERTNGDATYISPMTPLECETNNIVMLTDGVPFEPTTYYNDVDTIVGSNVCQDGWSCIIEFARYMANNDVSDSISGEQTITTDVIGFDIERDEENEVDKMQEYADAGKGQFLSVDNAVDLTSMMYEVVNTVLDVTTIALPGVAIDQANKLQLKDELYFSLFVPSEKLAWGGNLKKYFISGGTIVDVNGNPAIDPDTGMFIAETQSAWSGVQDGSESTMGGSSNRTTTDRNIFTYFGNNKFEVLSGDEYRFSLGNSTLTPKRNHSYNSNGNNKNAVTSIFMEQMRNDLEQNDTAVKAHLAQMASTDPDRYYADLTNLENFLDWVNGRDVFDDDADTNTSEPRLSMSDPLHVKPIVINYDETNSTLFVSTNDGTLHGVDIETGNELFAFVPKQLIKNLYKKAYINELGKHQYGLDLTWVAYRHDANRDGTIGDDSGDFVNIYGGMRRGGSSIYSLDVTKISGSQLSSNRIPTFNWEINPTVAGFEDLGQTWSTPVLGQIQINGVKKIVLIFGGGYDPQNDYVNIEANQKGSQIYIVDAMSGDLLWWASDTGAATLNHNDMKYSIPNKLEILDMDNDGLIDYIYANDVAGQIFKLKVNNENDGVSSLITARTFAEIGRTDSSNSFDDRRFYEKMTVVPVIDRDGKALYVATGTGYRARPFFKAMKDALFVFKDREINPSSFDSSKPSIKMDDLLNITTRDDDDIDIVTDLSAKEGYYMWFNKGLETSSSDFEGEKMIGNITASNNMLLFTTYVPNKNISEDVVESTSTERNYLDERVLEYYVDENGDDLPGKIITTCTGKWCSTDNQKLTNLKNGDTNVTYQMLHDFQNDYMDRNNKFKKDVIETFDWHQDFVKNGNGTTCRDNASGSGKKCRYTSGISGGENTRIYYFDGFMKNTVFKDSEALHPTVDDYPSVDGEIKDTQINSSTDGVVLNMDGNDFSNNYCEDTGLGKSRRYAINIYTAKPEKLNQNEVIDESRSIMEQRYKIDTVSGFSAGTKVLYTSDGVIAITNTTVEVIDDVQGLGLFKDRWLRLLRDDDAIVPPHIDTLRDAIDQ
jgi:hypothetical protein